jgi:hypothetical protein
MPTVRELLEREDFYDAAILRHGFVDYMRDYEVIVGSRDGPPYTDVHRYLFVGCAEAVCETAITPEWFVRSLPDDFVLSGPDYPEKDDPKGFIWGVRWAAAFPGLSYLPDGEGARAWSARLGRRMHEVLLETNAYRLRLVFADIRHAYLGTQDQPGILRGKDYPVPPTPADATSDGGIT